MQDYDFDEVELLTSVFSALFQIAEQAEKPTKKTKAQTEALITTKNQVQFYLERCIDPRLVEKICKKKVDAIMQAETIADLKTIVNCPRPTEYGGKITDHPKYQFDEEELVLWGFTSLKAPLNHIAHQRINVLFERVYGISLDDYCKKKP